MEEGKQSQKRKRLKLETVRIQTDRQVPRRVSTDRAFFYLRLLALQKQKDVILVQSWRHSWDIFFPNACSIELTHESSLQCRCQRVRRTHLIFSLPALPTQELWHHKQEFHFVPVCLTQRTLPSADTVQWHFREQLMWGGRGTDAKSDWLTPKMSYIAHRVSGRFWPENGFLKPGGSTHACIGQEL